MKAFIMSLALLSAASAVPLSAQVAPPRSGTIGNVQQGNRSCAYTQSTNSVGDLIFGRSGSNSCVDVNSRQDGAWYQTGPDANGNTVYARRIRDANGNLVIQRARRNRNGRFTIYSTRGARSSDREWSKAEKAQQKAYNKQQKMEDKRR